MRCLQTIYFVFSVPANNFFSIFFIPPLSRKIMVRPLGDLAARESTFRSTEETLENRSASNTLLNGVNKVSLLHTRLNITFQCTSSTEYPICSRRVNSNVSYFKKQHVPECLCYAMEPYITLELLHNIISVC